MRVAPSLCSAALLVATLAAPAQANPGTAMQLFADNCFSPYLTAQRAAQTFGVSGVSHDFYDLDPFSSADASPATGRAVTPGTDRRCEVSFSGMHAEQAAQAALAGLAAEGIDTPAPVPDTHVRTDGTALLAARQLNPRRIAVVHVGARDRAGTTETFMLVERLTPTAP